jgi:hypothetical protein
VTPAQIEAARANGILHPTTAAMACERSGLEYPAACALLMQETGPTAGSPGGGKNLWGHDPTIFIGGGDFGQPVTAESYAAYQVMRDSFDPPKCQGVGPTQLTSRGYQDQADRLGGCWKPLINMVVGFGIIAGWRADGKSWHDCWLGYSGGKESYADQMNERLAWWRTKLKEAT